MTVVPAGMLARRKYSASLIALALHLLLAVGLSDPSKRCAWQLRGRNARGWAQLYRWADRAADLFALPRPHATSEAGCDAVVGRVLTTLRSLSLVALGATPIAQEIFAGATRTR